MKRRKYSRKKDAIPNGTVSRMPTLKRPWKEKNQMDFFFDEKRKEGGKVGGGGGWGSLRGTIGRVADYLGGKRPKKVPKY